MKYLFNLFFKTILLVKSLGISNDLHEYEIRRKSVQNTLIFTGIILEFFFLLFFIVQKYHYISLILFLNILLLIYALYLCSKSKNQEAIIICVIWHCLSILGMQYLIHGDTNAPFAILSLLGTPFMMFEINNPFKILANYIYIIIMSLISIYGGLSEFGMYLIPEETLDILKVLVFIEFFVFLFYQFYYYLKITEESRYALDQDHKNIAMTKAQADLDFLTNGLSHEINNPLTFIRGNVSLIKKRNSEQLPIEEKYFNKILYGIDRIAVIVESLKNLANNDKDKKYDSYKIHDIIEDVTDICRHRIQSLNINLSISLFDKDSKIYCNKKDISIVLLNVISNSIDALEELDELKDKWINLDVIEDEQSLKIIIQDSGLGMGEELINNILKPFGTGENIGKGIGLGLSLCIKIMHEHKGTFNILPEYEHTTCELRFTKDKSLFDTLLTGNSNKKIKELSHKSFYEVYKELKDDPVSLFIRASKESTTIIKIPLGLKSRYLLLSPHWINDVLVKNSETFVRQDIFNKLTPVIGNGLVTADGQEWRYNRNILQPLFQTQNLNIFKEELTSEVELYMDKFESYAEEKKDINIGDELMSLTLRIIFKFLFNSDYNHEKLSWAFTELNITIGKRLWGMSNIDLYIPSRKLWNYLKAKRIINDFTKDLIHKSEMNPKAKNMITLLMKSFSQNSKDGSFNKQQVIDEILTFAFAGHETTATALSWTFYYLTMHPKMQDDIYNESKILADDEDLLTSEKLPKTRNIFYETMRIKPSVWFIPRNANKDITIDGYRFQKGDLVMVSPYLLHHNEKYWKNHDQFNPDRFKGLNPLNDLKTHYIPFGTGPHRCIGSNLAMLEASLILTRFFKRFTIERVGEGEISMEALVTLKMSRPLIVKIKKRKFK